MCCLSSKWYFYANPSWWWLCRESRNTSRTKFKRAKTHVHIIIVVVSLHNILFIFFCSCALCTVPWPASWFALVKKFTYFVVFSLHTNKKMLLAKNRNEKMHKKILKFVLFSQSSLSPLFLFFIPFCFHWISDYGCASVV